MEAARTQPELRLINGRTGEVEDTCESCLQYERTIRTLNGRLTRMERDREAEAEQHKRWPEAEALHTWWALATGHEGCRFAAEEFYQAMPRLKERSSIEFLQGIAGLAFDPNSKQRRNGTTERYDSWEVLTKSGPRFQRYYERAPGWPVKEHHWKRWLLDRIESRFR